MAVLTRAQIIGTDSPEAVRVVTVTREKLYPVVSRPGLAWVWIYYYSLDGGSVREYGTGLAATRSWLKRMFPKAQVVETWK